MQRRRSIVAAVIVVAVAIAAPHAAKTQAPKAPDIAAFLGAAFPFDLQSARKTDRLAWLAYDQGRRNVYTASAPDFRPVRVTAFLEDDGTEISDLNLSDDGSTVTYVRGTAPNRAGWIANPTADPDGAERAVWAARVATPGVAWRVVEASTTELAPDGSSLLFVRDGQIYRARVTPTRPLAPRDRGEEPFIEAWGTNSAPRWSPDGSKIAFASNRVDHGFICVYDMKTRKITYLAPSVDRDTSPTWTPDGKIAFLRRPGLPFGQQAQQGGGGIGLPNGPAYRPPAQGQNAGRGGRGGDQQGRGGGQGQGRGGGRGDPPAAAQGVSPAAANVPGLTRATFKGGYTLSMMQGDPVTGDAKEIWHTTADERQFANINNIRWAGRSAIFSMNVPNEEGARYFSITPGADMTVKPVQLTTTSGIIEDATSMALSKDGNTLYYCTNTDDIERRHIWAVPTGGGAPKQVTTGAGIETSPMPLASGKLAALTADAVRPQSVGLFEVSSTSRTAGPASQKVIFPSLAGFPTAAHVVPEIVTLKSPDGMDVHSQLFVPKTGRAGEKHAAMIFVHGGPVRQMLPGYHYMHFYHIAYAVNQWLQSQGYVVMSVNYRSGIGYGTQFRSPGRTGGAGNAEYQDVLTAGKYLQSRPDVDPKRVGIWGLSYGGVLTAQALARNSDVFAAGVDLAGVHLWGSSLDPESTSYQSSAIAAIDTWKSPVLIIHGDDDRNVAFQQTTGLVQLLRQRDVYYELIVLPDDTHETLLHSRWLSLFDRMDTFLKRFLSGN
jgi:dipeptidyl aminopeptidase/acylaminoacyl peptidase